VCFVGVRGSEWVRAKWSRIVQSWNSFITVEGGKKVKKKSDRNFIGKRRV